MLQGGQDHGGLNSTDCITGQDSFTHLNAVCALKQQLSGSGRKGKVIPEERSCKENVLARSHR